MGLIKKNRTDSPPMLAVEGIAQGSGPGGCVRSASSGVGNGLKPQLRKSELAFSILIFLLPPISSKK
jgi:hypothetical protein